MMHTYALITAGQSCLGRRIPVECPKSAFQHNVRPKISNAHEGLLAQEMRGKSQRSTYNIAMVNVAWLSASS